MRVTNQDQIREYLRRPLPQPRNKRNIFYCCLILCVAFFLPEVGSILSFPFPWIKTHMSDLFLSRTFKYKIQDYWYIKETCEDCKEILITLVTVKLAAKYSDFLFTATLILLVYSIIDLGMWWWNYATSVFSYWCILWAALVIVIGGFSWYKPDRLAQIKSLF